MNRFPQASADCVRASAHIHLKHTGVQALDVTAPGQSFERTRLAQTARQLALQRLRDPMTVAGRKSVQDQLLDVKFN
jgi:hypothetical protein